MAIGFARVNIHTRSQGHSAVAGAAYRSGSELFDSRTGEIHNFKNRHDVIHTEILLPENASQKFLDREYLWNAVETCEKRKDAQLAKDVILALPRGLDKTDLILLAKEFAQYHFVSKGLVADIAIHDHGDGNPHAHIYITTRRLLGDHFDLHKARDLNPSFANGRGGKGFIAEQDYWGEQWRSFQNSYFEDHAIDLIVDENHLISERHHGRVRSDQAHYLREENQLKREAAAHIALNDPESLINILSQRYSVFSERQLANILFKSTITQEEFQMAFARIKAHKEIICLGAGSDGKLRYTTRQNYLKEATMAAQAKKLSQQVSLAISRFSIEESLHQYTLNEEQKAALSYVLTGPHITALVGRSGTGKSYLMKVAFDYWKKEERHVIGISALGVASKALQKSSQIPSSTIASFKLKVIHQKDYLTSNSIVVMDEAGMTDLSDMAFVVNAVKEANAKLVLVGDPKQLQPIGPGAPFRALLERVGFVEMDNIQRQNDLGDRTASQQLALGKIDQALDHYEKKGAIHWHANPNDAMQSLISNWAKTTNEKELPQQLILAHRNQDIRALNLLAREALKVQKKLGSEEYSVEVIKRVTSKDGWGIELQKEMLSLSEGDRILFRRNDKTLQIMNGDFGTITALQPNAMKVKLEDNREIQIDLKQYHEFDYGYAATVHKAQGSTFDRVFIYAGGQGWNQHLAYVALTRHREKVELHLDKETYSEKEILKAHFSREEIKDNVLDWPLSYARRRGFDPESLIGRFIEKIGMIKESIQDKWHFIWNINSQNKNYFSQEIKNNKNPSIHPLKDPLLEWEQLKNIDQPQIRIMYELYNASKNKTDDRSLNQIYNSILQLGMKIQRKPDTLKMLNEKAPPIAKKIFQVLKSHKKDKGMDIAY